MEAGRERGMRFILVKQESAGAMLAATWGDITGAPGVCLSTRAPGAANMVNGVTHAWMDRSPLIAITDQYGPATYATGLRQRLDQLALYDSVTKWNATIAAATVRHSCAGPCGWSTAPPPGPVQLDCRPTRRLREAARPAGRRRRCCRISRSLRPDRASLEPALDDARPGAPADRPGRAWACSGTEPAPSVVALAEQLGAPVLTTTKARASSRRIIRCGPGA